MEEYFKIQPEYIFTLSELIAKHPETKIPSD